jgi:hypothetical protein
MEKAKMINKKCLEAFNKLTEPAYHPQEYFMLGWNAAIDALSVEFSRKWEADELDDIDFIVHPEQKQMYDDE